VHEAVAETGRQQREDKESAYRAAFKPHAVILTENIRPTSITFAATGVAMQTGTQAAGDMVDLDSDPTKQIEVVLIGKHLLITWGALTTFSIANDVAKYSAIIPAMFAASIRV
jgi:high-affinity K+ transport system ATPase subunit B